MNKKYLLRITVSLFFITNVSSYAMSKTQSVAMGLCSYIIYRTITNHRESKKIRTLPPTVEVWARKNMEKNGIKNAHTIPLGMSKSNNWECRQGCIVANRTDIEAVDFHLQRKSYGYYYDDPESYGNFPAIAKDWRNGQKITKKTKTNFNILAAHCNSK